MKFGRHVEHVKTIRFARLDFLIRSTGSPLFPVDREKQSCEARKLFISNVNDLCCPHSYGSSVIERAEAET